MDRGLEIRLTRDRGPHQMYYPYVCSVEHHRVPLVIAADDVLYGKTWLADLLGVHRSHPEEAGTGFTGCAPTADGVWLHALTVHDGVGIRRSPAGGPPTGPCPGRGCGA